MKFDSQPNGQGSHRLHQTRGEEVALDGFDAICQRPRLQVEPAWSEDAFEKLFSSKSSKHREREGARHQKRTVAGAGQEGRDAFGNDTPANTVTGASASGSTEKALLKSEVDDARPSVTPATPEAGGIEIGGHTEEQEPPFAASIFRDKPAQSVSSTRTDANLSGFPDDLAVIRQFAPQEHEPPGLAREKERDRIYYVFAALCLLFGVVLSAPYFLDREVISMIGSRGGDVASPVEAMGASSTAGMTAQGPSPAQGNADPGAVSVTSEHRIEPLPDTQASETKLFSNSLPVPEAPPTGKIAGRVTADAAGATMKPSPRSAALGNGQKSQRSMRFEMAKIRPPVTPLRPASPSPTQTEGNSPQPDEGVIASGELVLVVQTVLVEKGYDPGKLNGRAGPATQAAIRQFKRDHGLTDGKAIDQPLLETLGIVGRKISPFIGASSLPISN